MASHNRNQEPKSTLKQALDWKTLLIILIVLILIFYFNPSLLSTFSFFNFF